MTEKTPQPKPRSGRPLKGDGPRVNYQEVDRLLVLGEMITACSSLMPAAR